VEVRLLQPFVDCRKLVLRLMCASDHEATVGKNMALLD
jgi:hypothetical protein